MRNVIIIISALIFLTSCKKKQCEDVEGNLTAEELSWMSYSGGETLIFKSNNNALDTFYVGNKTTNSAPVYNGASDDCNHKQQSINCIINEHPFYLGFMGLYTKHKNEWSPDGKAYVSTDADIFNFSDYTPQNNVTINGNTYNAVYIMTVDTTFSKGIWRIFYTKQKGILRYDITQGEQWEKIN